MKDYAILLTVIALGIILSVKTKKLTINAAITGGVLAFLVFCGAGYIGVSTMAAFFILGTLATSWKYTVKEVMGTVEGNEGQRKTSQVLANAGTAGLCALMALAFPAKAEYFRVMLAASFASATGDTLSSELGTVYGKRFYNILTFKEDQRGCNGVISAEGMLAGFVSSLVIALIYWARSTRDIAAIVSVAGLAGNIADSVLGATFEQKHYMKNDAVNFVNTLIAALISLLFYICIS